MESGSTMLRHYQILEPLGKGGMGEVFLAEDTVLERKVAIKFLSNAVDEQDPQARKRFLREAHRFIHLAINRIGKRSTTGNRQGLPAHAGRRKNQAKT